GGSRPWRPHRRLITFYIRSLQGKWYHVAHLLGGENLSISFATRTVLDGVSVGLEEGDRIGIVGRNGDGKSTLMRLLAGRQTADSGRVTVRGGVQVSYLDQTDVL